MATKNNAKAQTGRTNARPTPATASRPVSIGRGSAAAPAPARERTKPVEPQPEEMFEEEIQDETLNEDVDLGGEASITNDPFTLTTTELDSPARKADAHRGRVVEVKEHYSETKNTPGFRIMLHSDDGDFDSRVDVYVPRPFAEDIHVDPRTLSKVKDEEAGTTNEQLQYAMGIHNKKNDATMDKLRAIAKGEGRSMDGFEGTVETFADLCAAYNYLLADCPVIFFRRPRKDNAQFLEVNDFLPLSAIEDPKMQSKFKGKVCAWMGE